MFLLLGGLYNWYIWFQDHMRKAGDVCFAEVTRDGEGIVFLKVMLQLQLQLAFSTLYINLIYEL